MAASSTATARRAAAPARTRRPRARPTPRSATRTARSPRRQPLTPMPARLVPLTVGRTAGAVSGLADSGLVHRLTRGRLWIGALTTLLVGIVALNVLALSFNASSSRVGRQADSLKREISALRAQIATDGSSNQRIQAAAARLGLIVPEPGSVGYLRPGHDDAEVAARRLVSGDLTTETVSVVVPLAPAIVPAAAPTTDLATDQTAVVEATGTAPATDATATTTTTETTSLAGGQGADGASGGGGGVAAP